MNNNTSGPAIHIENLTKDYGLIRAVDNVSLHIKSGGVLGLLGPNGAGKTTLMRMITGYLKPTRGTITVGDFDVREEPDNIKGLVGYLPEFSPLYQDMMIYDYLRYVAGIRGVLGNDRDARIREMSRICGLDTVMHQTFRELSRGFKQRVGLAHALVGDPEVLILDEPTSGLDPNQIVKIRSIVKNIGRSKTVILSTHLLSEAESTCERIVIINKGKLVADGTPQTLKSHMGDAHVVNLRLRGASVDAVMARLSKISGVEEVEVSGDEVLEVSLSCASDIGDEVYRVVKQQDWVIAGFSSERNSLESVFRDLTESKSDD